MLKIEAYIRPSSFPNYHSALVEAGVKGITIWETKGIGQQFHEEQKPEIFRGASVKKIYIDRVRIETVVEDAEKDKVIASLKQVAESGDLGTLQIFVTPILESIRVQ